jgi:hypothetical protein
VGLHTRIYRGAPAARAGCSDFRFRGDGYRTQATSDAGRELVPVLIERLALTRGQLRRHGRRIRDGARAGIADGDHIGLARVRPDAPALIDRQALAR